MTYTLDQEAVLARESSRIVELESRIDELQLLTGWIVHDISAPLRAVNGLGRIMLEDHGEELSEEARQLIERQSSAGKNALRLMEDVKQMIRSNAAPLRQTHVDLSALVNEVALEIKGAYSGRPEIQVEPDLWTFGDPLYLRYLFQNLLDNAIKHNAAPVPKVTVGESPGRSGSFFVRDNGVGFEMSEAERIFRPFERVDTNQGRYGTGLGLAIARRIVERHGGKIWAESAPEAGSTFWIVGLDRMAA